MSGSSTANPRVALLVQEDDRWSETAYWQARPEGMELLSTRVRIGPIEQQGAHLQEALDTVRPTEHGSVIVAMPNAGMLPSAAAAIAFARELAVYAQTPVVTAATALIDYLTIRPQITEVALVVDASVPDADAVTSLLADLRVRTTSVARVEGEDAQASLLSSIRDTTGVVVSVGEPSLTRGLGQGWRSVRLLTMCDLQWRSIEQAVGVPLA